MLLKWQRMKGSEATTQVLKEALASENVGREDLAEVLQSSLLKPYFPV